jgi:MFS transporter, DHA1 family, multidrug resistance protein
MHNKMSPSLVVVFLAMLLGIQPIATDLYLPALPALKDSLQGSHAQVQLTFTGLLLAFGSSQLVWGPLSDRFGRKPILLIGTGLFCLASVGAALVTSMEQLIIWRCLQGAAMGAAVMCARALIRDLYAPEAGARVLSKGLTGLGVFAVSSGPLGGWLANHFGWQGAMWTLVVFSAILTGMMLLWFKETLPQKNHTALQPVPMLRNWAHIARDRTFITYALLNVGSYGALFTFLASSSFVFQKVHGFSTVDYGWVLVMSSGVFIAATFWCRRLLVSRGLQKTVRVGGFMALLGGTSMGLLACSGIHHPAAFLIPHAFFMVSHGINQPCSQAGCVSPFATLAGTASALSGFWMMVAAFLMGTWLGTHMDGTVFPLVNGMWFWTTFVALVVFAMVPRWGKVGR